jgi:phytoene dehydrogenase-like protein
VKRPFKGLSRGAGPQRCYDAVVIGAGVGGLLCANLLAREGLRILLVERHYVVGGFCSAFKRNGYTFDAATHFYPLLGNPATITGELLARLGVQTEWVRMDPVDQFHLPDGNSFAVPADFDRYLARLKEEFPNEAGAIDQFFTAARQAYLLGLLCHFRQRGARLLEQVQGLTLRQALDRSFRNPRLKLLLTADCPHWGSPPARTSFVFDSMLRISYFLGNYYPRGGSQVFADELARRFEEQGGHILLSSQVTRILVEGGAARGVVVETGHVGARREQEVAAGAVISNADLRQTIQTLLDPQALPPEYVASVLGLRPTYPCFLMHVGLRGMPEEDLRRVHGYHWGGWDPDEVGRGALRFKLFVPTIYDPSLAPLGGQVLIVQKVLDMDYAGVADWGAHKSAVERYVLEHLERLLPGFAEKVVVRLSASAATSHRYTLNHHGAMLGWEMSPDQLGDRRPGIESPVKNLYFVGHWTRPGGGITPVIISAVQGAEKIVQQRSTPTVPTGQGTELPEVGGGSSLGLSPLLSPGVGR